MMGKKPVLEPSGALILALLFAAALIDNQNVRIALVCLVMIVTLIALFLDVRTKRLP